MIDSILTGKHKVVITNVQSIMAETGMSEQDAYYEYCNRMSKLAAKAGKKSSYRGFRDMPGLAQRAGRISKPYGKDRSSR